MQRAVVKLMAGVGLLVGAATIQAEDLLAVHRLALESDPQLRAAVAAYQAAQEARPQAFSRLLPQLNATADYTRNGYDVNDGTLVSPEDERTYNSTGYGVSLSQTLYRHQYFVQLRQADAVVAQADAQLGSARQEFVLRVAAAYFNVLAAQDNLEFAVAQKKAIGQQLRQTKQRFEVGLSAITDVYEAQAGYDQAVAVEIAARNQLDLAEEALREITGQPLERLAELSEQMPLITPEPTDIEQWVNAALEQNLELLAAEAGARVAREEVKARRAVHYPTLDLVGTYSFNDSTDAGPGFGNERADSAIGVQLNIPIYQGGLISSRTQEAEYLYTQAQELLEQQRRATVRQARAAYLNVTAGISQVAAFRQALASAQTALEATQAGFEVGTRTAVDVLNAQRELFLARRDYARARYDYILSTLSLKQAAGTLSGEDLVQVNAWLE